MRFKDHFLELPGHFWQVGVYPDQGHSVVATIYPDHAVDVAKRHTKYSRYLCMHAIYFFIGKNIKKSI